MRWHIMVVLNFSRYFLWIRNSCFIRALDLDAVFMLSLLYTLLQDVHTELIQHRRAWMIKRGIVKEKLSVNSAERRLNGSCPLMPEEVSISGVQNSPSQPHP